jgi:hypothetical protein
MPMLYNIDALGDAYSSHNAFTSHCIRQRHSELASDSVRLMPPVCSIVICE